MKEGTYYISYSFSLLDYPAAFYECVITLVVVQLCVRVPTATLCCSLDLSSFPSHEVKALLLLPRLQNIKMKYQSISHSLFVQMSYCCDAFHMLLIWTFAARLSYTFEGNTQEVIRVELLKIHMSKTVCVLTSEATKCLHICTYDTC